MDYFFKYVKLNNTFCAIKQEKNAQNSKFFLNHVKNIQFCIFYSNFFIHLVQNIIKIKIFVIFQIPMDAAYTEKLFIVEFSIIIFIFTKSQ